ncbi:MAG: hypothetical protein ABEI57_05780 [Halapricum sp.]
MKERDKTRRRILKTVGVGAIGANFPGVASANPGHGKTPTPQEPERFLKGKPVFVDTHGLSKHTGVRTRKLTDDLETVGTKEASSIHSADVAIVAARNRYDKPTLISALNSETTCTFAGDSASDVLPSILEVDPADPTEDIESSNLGDLEYNIGLSSADRPSDICVANPIPETGNINVSYYDTRGKTNRSVPHKTGKTIGLDQAYRSALR